MKKLVFLLFLSVLTIANTNSKSYFDRIINQRLEVTQLVQNSINRRDKLDVYADFITAEEFLRHSASHGYVPVRNLSVFFPTTASLEDFLEAASKNLNQIEVILLEKPSNELYLEDRDYEAFKKTKVFKKINDLKNVKVIKVDIPKKYLSNLFIDSLVLSPLETGAYYEVIKEKLEQNR